MDKMKDYLDDNLYVPAPENGDITPPSTDPSCWMEGVEVTGRKGMAISRGRSPCPRTAPGGTRV
ncbi:MAG: hypothetical protein H5T73_05510 [Actinobacteria bacterium]|nr:hypothetical protein [Actinomycetota bacterium]